LSLAEQFDALEGPASGAFFCATQCDSANEAADPKAGFVSVASNDDGPECTHFVGLGADAFVG
jgi:hypothetical protein